MLKILVISPPRGSGYLMQEECCYNILPSPVWTSKMPQVLSSLRKKGYQVTYLDLATTRGWDYLKDIGDRYDVLVMQVVYPYLPLLLPGIVHLRELANKAVVLLVDPPGYVDDVATLTQCTAIPSDWTSVSDTFWGLEHAPIDPQDLRDLEYQHLYYQVGTGCRYRCGFCVWAGRPFSMRPAEIVVQDLELLHRRWPRVPLTLLVSQITHDREWLAEFCRIKQDRLPELRYRTDLSPIESARIPQVGKSGCYEALLGVEALSDGALAKLRKPHRVQHVLEALDACKRHGISPTIELRSDYGETAEEVIEQLDVIDRIHRAGLEPGKVLVGPITYWKGTGFYEDSLKDLVLRHQAPLMPVYRRRDIGRNREAWMQVYDRIRGLGWRLDG